MQEHLYNYRFMLLSVLLSLSSSHLTVCVCGGSVGGGAHVCMCTVLTS